MDEPDWSQVLVTLYQEEVVWSADDDIDGEHELVEATGLEPSELKDELAFLEQTGLVGRIQTGVKVDFPHKGTEGVIGIPNKARRVGTHVGLTPTGFEVAHERELNQQRNRTNRVLAILTAGLFYAALIQAQAAYLQIEQAERNLFGASLFVIIAIILGGLYAYDII